jgi:hypothetical protein
LTRKRGLLIFPLRFLPRPNQLIKILIDLSVKFALDVKFVAPLLVSAVVEQSSGEEKIFFRRANAAGKKFFMINSLVTVGLSLNPYHKEFHDGRENLL